jgi:hypothetical protein
MPRGGNRGGGRPKGSKNKSTLDKELLREQLRAIVAESLRPMTDAQVANAQGIKYLVARNKRTGEFKKLSEAEAILKMGQESDSEIIEVWEERPNVQAFTDLMNRTLDKPTEHVAATVTVQGLDERIRAAAKRAGK